MALFIPQEDDKANQDTLEEADEKNREPVKEGLINAKNSDKTTADNLKISREAECAHEFEFGSATGE